MATRKANGVSYVLTEEGNVRMTSPKTIKRYVELQNKHPKTENYGVFFAFGSKQFEEGYQSLIDRGYIKQGDKVCSAGMGLYGKRTELDRYLAYYKDREKMIVAECDPQEVYFYECNQHECGYTWCDDDAVQVVAGYFGPEAAHKLVRIYAGSAIDELAPLKKAA